MRLIALQTLTWGTVTGSIACALWLAAINGDAPRNTLSPLAGLDLPFEFGLAVDPAPPAVHADRLPPEPHDTTRDQGGR
jgi:hypothetical protein